MSKINFKVYNQHQEMIFPPNVEELIEANHPVRVINTIIEGLNINAVISGY